MKPVDADRGWTGTARPPLSTCASPTRPTSSRSALTANAAGSQATGLGSVPSSSNYLRKNRTVTFASTALLGTSAAGGSVVTITLGAASDDRAHVLAAVAMKWTPSAAAIDLAGSASSSATVTESGALGSRLLMTAPLAWMS